MRVGLWAWALTLSSAAALFPIPDQGALKVFCFDLKCVQESLDTLKTHLGDPIVVGMLSFSLQEDSYLSVYLGRILDLFHFPDTLDSPALPVAVLILQNPPQANLIETAFVYLQMLPRRSVFVSMQHGPSVGMVELANFAKYGVSPRTVLHLNHEEPWETDRGSPNFVAEEGQLGELYRGFDLVLRNYYFAPLEGVGAGEGVGAEEGVGAGAGEGDTSTVASTFSGTSTGTSGNSSDPPAVGSAGSVSPFVGGSHFLWQRGG
ncbi:hypothetical protein B484DRAFT_201488 [Ochromonadaceae sp. CCMP2298]|nr:hypothetical protein B484DRAFT_201488 [Ochromonadaceae sp. CCMP2298]